MKYVYKQLWKELVKNRIFAALLLILTAFTSYMYYFVHFSIDGNMELLNRLKTLTHNEQLYRNALVSNTILARNILIAFMGLTGFVFGMFFHRFLKLEKKNIGCLRALGFQNDEIRRVLTVFTASITLIGALCGLLTGYFTADILINAGRESYLVEETVKKISPGTFMTGIFVPMLLFCSITFGMYFGVLKKDVSWLISGVDGTAVYSAMLGFADRAAACFPKERRLQVRLALRKPVTVLLIVTSVMTFTIMFILAYSLNLSSGMVYRSQTEGRNYKYAVSFDTLQCMSEEEAGNKQLRQSSVPVQRYLDTEGTIKQAGHEIVQTVRGMEWDREMLRLADEKGNPLEAVEKNEIIIGKSLQEIYGLDAGDSVALAIGGIEYPVKIAGIAFNADMNCIYIDMQELTEWMNLPAGTYSGLWSGQDIPPKGSIITWQEKIDGLHRDSVSNRTSAVINQVIGILIGSILLFLALSLNFQDSTRDIVILQLMGYTRKETRKMLMDIYRPLLNLSFFLTLFPSVWIVKAVLRSLSIQIGDYMPFQTNIIIIAGIFLLINGIYQAVQLSFDGGIRRIVKRENTADYTN